ncbi:sugar phosphate isomerase/epimerase family protein [Lignipirellula cremea]|uniref:Inosose isomerase n=1 Tax=Lignipirellula cremea TaxID=2528010 RepID=A0A518DWF6_9BACT|nr:sugar phosphate isomerase/epimerase [Lignipirellula cremea]QDU96171.1 Inosose isomerase [Lignipirellula cremea]
MSLTLCLNTSTIRPQPLLEKIRLAAEAGFTGVELWLNDVYEYIGRGGEVRDVEQALADYGLMVPCMIAMRQWGEASELEYPLMLEEAKRRMELAARLGSPYLVATPPREACPLDQLAERYGRLLAIGRQVGVKPTFEYISFFHSARSPNDAWQVVQQVGDPDATLILDSFHNWNSLSTLDDLHPIPIERISHYHINDAHPAIPAGEQTDPDRVMPGDGPIDLAAEIALLQEKGYAKTISLELFNRELWEQPPAEVLQTCMTRLRKLTGV